MDHQFYAPLGDRGVECLLCPHHCVLKSGMKGLCRVRKADADSICASPAPITVIAEDPIEKKPFYHFHPGTHTLSLGFSGCNMACPFCQNHVLVESEATHRNWTPDFILQTALDRKSSSVCFTYSEPTMHIEFLIECSSKLQKAGIPVLLVTNGCINTKAAEVLLNTMTAVKVDLKSFNADWYKKELKGDLDTVCNFIRTAYGKCHLEIVTLIIPGKNDSKEELSLLSGFIGSISREIPLHLTAYYPQHKYSISPTPAALLEELKQEARKHLDFVYTGNTGRIENTYCPDCHAQLIQRQKGETSGILENSCSQCGRKIYGIF